VDLPEHVVVLEELGPLAVAALGERLKTVFALFGFY
jgi:hypothetical protein